MIRRLLLTGLVLLGGCTSDPNAPVNQVWPVPQLDRAFGDPHPPSYTQPLVARRPGYLPAYPRYDGDSPYPPGVTPP
ncbi:MAG TPA: hypothetical protein VHB27_22465 [Rhodopila sp.]|uniref:hypothetical protein n=1 Tax=Rhodopila sp. TaxID=2480087 RepID=UPI002CE4B6AA|nr:hypothetical protein [Rhodopila sp.]HVY17999.1 hypothetical protein [Rhodopila sp.]